MKKISIEEMIHNEVSSLPGKRFSYMVKKLKAGLVISSMAAIMFFSLTMWEGGASYLIGFLSGCFNFLLLTLSIGIITSARYKKPVLVQRLLFIARYLIVINILIRAVSPSAANIILFCVGFLCVNFSIIISSYKFKLNTR